MLNVRKFSTDQEVNQFADEVKVSDIQYYDGEYIVFYKPYLNVSDVRDMKIKEDKESAMIDLTQAEMHMEYLVEVLNSTDDDKKEPIKTGIENTAQNITNAKAKLEVVKRWKQS